MHAKPCSLPPCAPQQRAHLPVAYAQSTDPTYSISAAGLASLKTTRILSTEDPATLYAFVAAQYAQGVRRVVLNVPSSLLAPFMELGGVRDFPTVNFSATYSTSSGLRASAPPNLRFCITANDVFIPKAFALALGGESSNGLATVVGGPGPYVAEVEAYSRSLGAATYRLPGDAAALTAALPTKRVLALGIDSPAAVAQLNDVLRQTQYKGDVYSLDIAVPLAVPYYAVFAGVGVQLDASKALEALRSGLTQSILPNNSASVVLVNAPESWVALRSATVLSSGNTDFGFSAVPVAATKALARKSV